MSTSYVTVGREVDGDPAKLAPLAAAWWRTFVQVVKIRLGLQLEIIQARGRYSGSGGTHADGWAVDIRTWRFNHAQILALVALARECGASATWYRTNVGSGPHIHMVVDTTGINTRTKPHYQTVAVRHGRDGLGRDRLGRRGWKRPDPHPKPARWRNAREGIAHMQTIIEKENDLPLSDSDLKKIADVVDARIKAAGWSPVYDSKNAPKNTPSVLRSSWRNNMWNLHAKLDRIIKKIGA